MKPSRSFAIHFRRAGNLAAVLQSSFGHAVNPPAVLQRASGAPDVFPQFCNTPVGIPENSSVVLLRKSSISQNHPALLPQDFRHARDVAAMLLQDCEHDSGERNSNSVHKKLNFDYYSAVYSRQFPPTHIPEQKQNVSFFQFSL